MVKQTQAIREIGTYRGNSFKYSLHIYIPDTNKLIIT